MADIGHVICLRLNRLRHRRECGFTLVEAVVALMISAMLLMALAFGLVTQLRGTSFARSNQQAIDNASDQIERVRALNYAAVAMDPTGADFAGDKCTSDTQMWCILDAGSGWNLRYPDPNNSSVPVLATIYTAAGAGVKPHVVTCGGYKTCKTYVTRPAPNSALSAGSDTTYRVVTFVVQWSDHGVTHTRVDSTQVTDTRRGLPLPVFTWGPNGCDPAACVTHVTVGNQLDLFATLANRGGPTAFSFSVTVKGADGTTQPWPFQFFKDDNGNGALDPGETTSLTIGSDGNTYRTSSIRTSR